MRRPSLWLAAILLGLVLAAILLGLACQVNAQTVSSGGGGSSQRIGLRVQAFGDSEDDFNAVNELNGSGLPAGSQFIEYNQAGVLAQANHFLGGRLNFDLSLGYGPAFYSAGPIKVIVTSGGNYSTPPTSAAVTGCGTTTLGTPIMNSGAVVSVPITAVTAACSTGSVVTFSGGVGTAATAYVISGHGGTFGSPGATTAQMLNYLPDMIAAPVDVVAMHGGTNDYGAGITVAQTEANLISIWTQLMASGKSVVYFSLLPRNTTGVAAQMNQLAALNRWARQWIAGEKALRTTNYGTIIFVDRAPECTDQTSTSGNFLATCSTDGLHEGVNAPWLLGYKLAQALSPLLGGAAFGQALSTSQLDTFDATNNLVGALAAPTFYNFGTNGTITAPCTGVVPAGWTLSRNSGTATGTICVGSQESTRTDLISGSREVVTQSLGSGGSAEQYSISNGFVAMGTLPVTAGTDAIYAEALVELSGIANMTQLQLQVSCYNNLGQSQDQTEPPNSGTLYGPAAGLQLLLRTPPIVCPAASTFVSVALQWTMNASGGAGSATATIKVSNMTLRKYL